MVAKKQLVVTGGTGMVGAAFAKICPDAELLNRKRFSDLSFNVKNKNIVHLAAKVGGVKANSDQISDFYCENSIINEKYLDTLKSQVRIKLYLYYQHVFILTHHL